MNNKTSLLKSAKYIVVALFALLAILSVIFMGMVGTNYNISDYLDEETDTKISLGIMEKEFGLISNIQVMVDGVEIAEAKSIKDELKAIKNVVFVNFNEQSKDYYKEKTALFVILVEGNEYSDTAKEALADVMKLMDKDYGDRVSYGGTVMEKKLLREAIQGEIVLILLISVCLVALLMLITAASWIEPLVLLAASGIAVLLNMGSNIIFGEISYITKAVAAILQLALSIDYSIVLLHSYRAMKQKENDNDKAMLLAIKEVVKPVSASALTTIAGLLALLFMSFTIGFDIGIVLMKSIVVSAICSLTLLPALLLLLDKLMQKTPKKPLIINGKLFAEASFKAGKFIIPVALVAIVIGCIISSQNSYNFVDSCNKNTNITDKFGDNGTLIVLFEKNEDSDDLEKKLVKFLESYRTEEGKEVLKNSVAYSSTIGQVFDVEKASTDLGISESDAKLLFTIYYFNQDNTAVRMTNRQFVEFAIALLNSDDEDAKDMVPEETDKILQLLLDLEAILKEDFKNADQLSEKAEQLSGKINEIIDLDTILADSGFSELINKIKPSDMPIEKFVANYVYCLRFYDNIENKTLSFDDILTLVRDFSDFLPGDTSSKLNVLMDSKDRFEELKTKVDREGFEDYIEKNNVSLEGSALSFIWEGDPNKEITIIDNLKRIKNDYPSFFPKELVPIVDNFNDIDSALHSFYEYDKLISSIEELTNLIGQPTEIPIDNELVKQLYLMHFAGQSEIVPEGEMSGIQLLEFLSKTASELLNNDAIYNLVADKIDENKRKEIIQMLDNLVGDAEKLTAFLDSDSVDDYSYEEMPSQIVEFIETIESISLDNVNLSDTAIMGVYVKYAAQENVYELAPLSATTLLDFVLDAKDNNPLLAGKIDEKMAKTIEESKENMASAEKLLISDNYQRMLLTVNLPPESAESSRFVEALSQKVREIFGEEAYVAGEIATTNDLIKAFDDDNSFISVFTVVSIFLIILVVFKSLSLPVLLVAVIQGSVWIAMSFTLISGGSMFFMSYIMSMCILMGATIDYGILLSTNYINYRATMEKRVALEMAINSAMPTIFNSGLILMICGFIVGLVATQTSISSVGFLLCRGTLVSVLMITLVLPSLLYLLDKLVLKMTVRKSLGQIFKLN